VKKVALKRRPKCGLKSFALHWDNASPHQSDITTEEINKEFMMLLPHPAYSPHLAPSDFFLFGYLKDKLRGKKFMTKLNFTTI
jgi:histone-lysine N-methyltransferase SETMAR